MSIFDFGHWDSKQACENKPACFTITGEFIIPFGFLYEIVNNVSGRKYIGKKQMLTTLKRPPLKGKKNKRHSIKETDWRSYCGSCNELLKDIEELGKDKFVFNITRFCNSKWELSYFEAKEQFEKDVLLTDVYYNGIIDCRVGNKPKNYEQNIQ